MDRREFLKKALHIGGLAALSSMGAIKEAQALGILPGAIIGSAADAGGTLSWTGWDEDESTLDIDQDGDGSDDTHICVTNATAQGDNEVGIGVGTGGDLIWYQHDNVPAYNAVNDGRRLDTDGEFFYKATGAGHSLQLISDLLSNQSTFTILAKGEYVNPGGYGGGIFDIFGITERFRCSLEDDSTPTVTFLADYAADSVSQTTAMQLASGTVYWFAIWNTGAATKGGVATVRPTVEGDFDEVETMHADAKTVANDTWSQALFFNRDNYTLNLGSDFYCTYFLISKLNLFA